jgi:hypothetical protein
MNLSVFSDPATFANWAFGSGWHYLLCGIPAGIVIAILYFLGEFGRDNYERRYENLFRGFFLGIFLWPLAYLAFACIFLMWLVEDFM